MKAVIDDTSLRLLEALQLNGRDSNQNLAETIGISPSPCLERRKRLEDIGVIAGYETRINLKKMAPHVLVITEITIRANQISVQREFEKAIRAMDIAVTTYAVSGTVDYFVIFCAPDMDYYLEATDILTQETGVIETLTSHVIMNVTKPFSGYPLRELLESTTE